MALKNVAHLFNLRIDEIMSGVVFIVIISSVEIMHKNKRRVLIILVMFVYSVLLMLYVLIIPSVIGKHRIYIPLPAALHFSIQYTFLCL